MTRLVLAFTLAIIALPTFAQPEPLRRCLSDAPCRDKEYCSKPSKDQWGTCMPRFFSKATCSNDNECPSGYACQRPNTSAEWTCKKRR